MLCRLWVAFSAMHSARWSGSRKFISDGASVPGVIWKTNRTPSTVSVCPVWVTSIVAGSSAGVPVEAVKPSPMPTSPAGPRSRFMPP